MADRTAIVERVREIAERVGPSENIEIVEIQLLGGGGSRLLRIFIDKPEGVTHADCEFISQHVGDDSGRGRRHSRGPVTRSKSALPGVERKLSKPRDFERFSGHKVKLVLRQPVENQRHWEGSLEELRGRKHHP